MNVDSPFQSTINLSKTSTRTGTLVPHSQAYLRLFFILKGQRSMIESVIPSIEELLLKSDELEESVLSSFIVQTNKLLDSTLGTFFPYANNFVHEIHSNFLTENMSQEAYRQVLKALKATLAITRNLALIQVGKDFSNNDKFRSPNIPGNNNTKTALELLSNVETIDQKQSNQNSHQDDYIVCRICDQRVRSDLFEEHTESCMKAYQNESKIASINSELLEIQKIFINDFLNTPWPGRRDVSISTSLPILHVSLLLNRAYEIDTHSIDSSDELLSIFLSLEYFLNISIGGTPNFSPTSNIIAGNINSNSNINSNVNISSNVEGNSNFDGSSNTEGNLNVCGNFDEEGGSSNSNANVNEKSRIGGNFNASGNANSPNLREIIVKLRQKVNEKKCASNAIREAGEILSRTRINGSNLPSFATQTSISDFLFIKQISSGAFARVFLAKKKSTGDVFAIKVQPKDDVIQKNQVKRVMAEKDILLQFNNPYIINFYYSFVGLNNLYIVMEYLPGGDLYSLLQNVSALDEDSARIYTFQITRALGYLHSRGIIHRDIKPDNILIAADGTLRLTDFGLSYIGFVDRRVSEMSSTTSSSATSSHFNKKFSNNNNTNNTNNLNDTNNSNDTNNLNSIKSNENVVEAKSLVGTPDYIAPEIILNLAHTFTVDWWSLGVMVYEFVVGIPPFHGDTVEETRDLILKGRYRRPTEDEDGVSKECADFINCLLQQNPKKRLGSRGMDEVLHHKWLEGVDLTNVHHPFVPELQGELDTTYFEDRYQSSLASAPKTTPNNANNNTNNVSNTNMNSNMNSSMSTAINSNNGIDEFDDDDILADLQMSEKLKTSSFTSLSGCQKTNSFLASSPSDCDDSLFEAEMNNFPSVSVEQLVNTNRLLSSARRNKRTRASSFAEDSPSVGGAVGLEDAIVADSPIASRSFVGLNPVASGTRRNKRKPSFVASIDDFKKYLPQKEGSMVMSGSSPKKK